MRLMLVKFSVLVMTCCFFPAVVELDIGDYHQTFFDDYDTYLPDAQLDFHVEGNAHQSSHIGFSVFYSSTTALIDRIPDSPLIFSYQRGPDLDSFYKHQQYIVHCALLI